MASIAENERKQYVSYTDCEIVSHRVHGVKFSTYCDEEIKRLSLKNVHQLETFDCMGHATSGGLYDLELGPQRVEGPCVTCGLNMQDASSLHKYLCPGHFGHIQLPMPVFNPVLFKELIQILRIMCFKCHRLMISSDRSILFTYQMKALKLGLLSIVFEMQEIHSAFSSHSIAPEDDDLFVETSSSLSPGKLEENLEACLLTASKNVAVGDSVETKCLIDLRQSLVKQFLLACAATTVCTHCRQPRLKIRQENFRKVYFERSSKLHPARHIVPKDIKTENNAGELLSSNRQQLHPHVLRTHLRELWSRESTVLTHVVAVLTLNADMTEQPTDMFFKSVQVVPPTRFRQLLDRNSSKMLHPETDNLLHVLKEAQRLRTLLKEANSQGDSLNKLKVLDSLEMACQNLQGRVNAIYDCRFGRMFLDSKPITAVVQLLEHKSGLLRWNMMGKRVDFAARSVISPDPCIATNEVGIPLYFAKRLTYPEPVTPHNVSYLRHAVINGPDVYPGATHIILATGKKKKVPTATLR